MTQDMSNFGPPPPAMPSVPTVKPAGYFLRAIAVLIDQVIISLVSLPITLIFGGISVFTGIKHMTTTGMVNTSAQYIVGIAISAVYHCYFYKKKGATPGKLLFNIKVVNFEDGTFLNPGQTLLREIIGKWVFAFLNVFLLIPLIMAVLRKDKRGVHDFIGGTRVLRRIEP